MLSNQTKVDGVALPKGTPIGESNEARPRRLKSKVVRGLLFLAGAAILIHVYLLTHGGTNEHWISSWHRTHDSAPNYTHDGKPLGQAWRLDDADEPIDWSLYTHGGRPHGDSHHHGQHHHRNGSRHGGHHSNHTLRTLSRKLLSTVSEDHLRKYAEHYFLAGPHLSAQNEALSNWTESKFESYGFDARTETYDIWVNYPVSHRVALLKPNGKVDVELKLEEPVLDKDPTTGDPERIPTFHGFSASGNATGELVYANLGRKQDYDRLVDEGIDLKDKIVIVRYGSLFRGLKVKFAEDLGAAAVLIYSDPAEDGEITEANGYKAYPDGPARHPESVQRGSVQYLSFAPGDPTTPGFPSIPEYDKNRTSPHGILTIPSVPISYADALPLLKSLNGHGPTFDDWKGALDDVKYSVGPSKSKVLVDNSQDYDFRPNRDVIATIEGKSKDTIIVGNHRDAWILGGADPNSGSAVLIELARVLGKLVDQGWKPQRTIVLASWDGEEYGLLGSTEWGEDHASELMENVVAYLNVDVSVSGGEFGVSANPLLREAIEFAAHRTPYGNSTLSKHWGGDPDTRIQPLGSGSDYTVFQDFLGIPSLDTGFTGLAGGENPAVYHYHSNYDSWHWMTEFGDPDFSRHAAVTKFLGLMLIDLVERRQTPFSVVNYAKSIKRELKALLKNYEGPAVEEVGALFGEVYHFLHAAKKFTARAKQLEREIRHFERHWWNLPKYLWYLAQERGINSKLKKLDRLFLFQEGLEDRTWFKHLIYAPGRYTGYAGQVFPGIAESLEDGETQRLLKWVQITADALRNAAASIS